MNTHVTRRILWAFFAVMISATAHGSPIGLFRAYLSVNGNDANPCTVAAPCRLLPAALAAVNSGGEIWMLDSANFNTGTVTITKSVTILAVPGALGSIVANGADAILIDTALVTVALRNLVVVNLSGTNNTGINFNQGAELTVENCEIYGTSYGIGVAAANSVIAVKSTVVRDVTGQGMHIVGTVDATLDRVHILKSVNGLVIGAGVSVAVSNSVIASNSNMGIYIVSGAAPTSGIHVANSVIHDNGAGIWGQSSSTNAVSITLERSALFGNGVGVNATVVAVGSTLTVVLDDNALINNGTAINYVSPAVVYSRGNNSAKANGTDVSGPALTSLGGL